MQTDTENNEETPENGRAEVSLDRGDRDMPGSRARIAVEKLRGLCLLSLTNAVLWLKMSQ